MSSDGDGRASGAALALAMQHDNNTQARGKANIRLAILLGLVAFGFFVLGIYLMATQ